MTVNEKNKPARRDSTGYQTLITPGSVGLFFVLAYAVTWGLSLFAKEGLLPFAIPSVVSIGAAVLLHYGPALAAVFLIGLQGGKPALAGFGRSLLNWRAGPFWWAFIFIFPVLLRFTAVGIDVLLGGTFPKLMTAAEVPDGNPFLLLPVVFILVFFQAGLAEEPGWRGYALPGLQSRWGAVTSSVILSLVWSLWHFHPVNFEAMWPIAPWYVFNIVPFTILMTWVYNNSGKSLLIVAMFHTASNVSDWIVPSSSIGDSISSVQPFIIQGVLTWMAALIVIFVYGPKTLTRSGEGDKPVQELPR